MIGRLWAKLFGSGKPLCCRDATEFLMSYLDGDLPPDVKAEFERHLAACGACRHYLESYKATVAMGKKACQCDAEDAKVTMPDELVAAIMAAAKRGEKP